MKERRPDDYRKILFPALLALLCLSLIAVLYGGFVVVRGLDMYADVKGSGQGYIGKLYDTDPQLGYVNAAGADGFNAIPLGVPIATHHDDEGLVAPFGVKHSFQGKKHPRLLFLGCSFTYGAMVAAEDSYPYKTALQVQGEAVNAAVPGYGLAQMVLQARRLIPRYKPDYVVVQYSPWLVERAVTPFAPAYNQLIVPVPYYAGNGVPAIAPPAFRALPHSLDYYRASSPGLGDKLSFLWSIALPKYLHDDIGLNWFRLRQALGLAKKPSRNPVGLVREAYADMAAVAARNHAKLIIMVIGSNVPLYVPEGLFPPEAVIVNGQQVLLAHLPVADSDSYIRAYWHWRGNPPQPVDWHPNARAHELLANALAQRIATLSAETR